MSSYHTVAGVSMEVYAGQQERPAESLILVTSCQYAHRLIEISLPAHPVEEK